MELQVLEEYMKQAQRMAKQSLDPNTKVGAVILLEGPAGELTVGGFNVMPIGVRHLPQRWERPEKYEWVIHAEMDALIKCLVRGYSTRGAILFSTKFPCSRCMGPIINAGISAIYSPSSDESTDRWSTDAVRSLTMAREARLSTFTLDLVL